MIQRHQRLHVDAFPLLSFVAALGEAFCGFFANSIEVCVRKPGTLGARYLSSLGLLTTIFLAGFVHGTLEFVMALRGEIGGLIHAVPGWMGNPLPPLQVQAFLFRFYSYLVLAMGLVHLVAQWLVNRNGLKYHTYFSGIPLAMPLYARLPWSDLITVKTYYEPLCFFLASYLVGSLDSVLGTWIWFASICMFIRAKLHYSRARAAQLDAHDAMIEAEDIFASIRLTTMPRPSRSRSANPAASPATSSSAPAANAGAILDDLADSLGQAPGARGPSR